MKKLIISIVLSSSIIISPMVTVKSYAEPSFFNSLAKGIGRGLGNVVENMAKKENQMFREINDNLFKESKEAEIAKTVEIYKQKSKHMDREDARMLKEILDNLTGKEAKTFEDTSKQKSSNYGRLKGKNLTSRGHEIIRNHLKLIPEYDEEYLKELKKEKKKAKSDKEITKAAIDFIEYHNNPLSDRNYQDIKNIITPVPLMNTPMPSVNPMPLNTPIPIF